MSKNDHHKVDFSVHCQSDLDVIDLQSWNENKEESGKFLLANLLEIRLSFKHYRCGTFADRFNDALGPSCPQSPTVHTSTPYSVCKPPYKAYSQLIPQSLPSSPQDEVANFCETSNLLPQSKSSTKQAIRFNSKDFHVLISKFARFKRLNLESAGAKLSCLHSRSRTKTKKFFSDPNEEVLIGGSKRISSPQLTYIRKCAHTEGFKPCPVCEISTKSDQSDFTQGIEILSGLSSNPVNSVRSGANVKHLVESHPDHIPNTQTDHSSSQSFSNIYSPLPIDAVAISHSKNPLIIDRFPSCKPSQLLDFRSISEYGFIQSNISEHSTKADVCSLPTCMDNEMSSHVLESSFSGSQHRIPSYVSISRAISGYADYNKYSPELKRDNSLLDNFLLVSRVSPSPSDPRSAIKQRTVANLITDDQVDNFCSLPYESTHDKICLADSSKSFLQKKIESLYGESFAEDWRKSRFKATSTKSGSSTDKTRSPSCPPRSAIDDVNSSINSFQKINSLDTSESSDLTFNSNNKSSQSLQHIQPNSAASNLDGHWFLSQLNRRKNELQGHIERYENIISSTEAIPDQVVGKIRATIGKANLLINKKLNQFDQLCHKSIMQQDDQKYQVKSDDLRGFWDMVMIQIEEVNNGFEMLDNLKQNNWQLTDDDDEQLQYGKKISNPKQDLPGSPRSFTKKLSPKNSPKSASPNGLEKEKERKNRLMEIKRKGKLKARDHTTEEEITIFVPTVDIELEK